MQLVVGLCYGIAYKLTDIVVHSPFGIYRTFWIEVDEGLSEATFGTYLCERFTILLEFTLLNIPIMLLLAYLVNISGWWLPVILLFATGIVKVLILWVYPTVIMPLFSEYSSL